MVSLTLDMQRRVNLYHLVILVVLLAGLVGHLRNGIFDVPPAFGYGGGGGSYVRPQSSTEGSSSADISPDGKVDILDFNTLMVHWDEYGSIADIDSDGIVGFSDFNLLMVQWTE